MREAAAFIAGFCITAAALVALSLFIH